MTKVAESMLKVLVKQFDEHKLDTKESFKEIKEKLDYMNGTQRSHDNRIQKLEDHNESNKNYADWSIKKATIFIGIAAVIVPIVINYIMR